MGYLNTRPHLRIGVQLFPQHTTYESYANAVRHADALGIDTIWNWDHFFPTHGDQQGNHFEGWTLLTAMAFEAKHAEIGCLVTCNSYRNPALLANMAKTLDHISNGRVILGIGAGWFDRDYYEYGYEFGTTSSRMKSLEKSLTVIRERWKLDTPPPKRSIPILIGGGGEKVTLRIAAQYADMWHGFGDLETYKNKVTILNAWCSKLGRNLTEIELCASPKGNLTPEYFDAYVKAGATHIILGIGQLESINDPWGYKAMEKLIRWRDSRI